MISLIVTVNSKNFILAKYTLYDGPNALITNKLPELGEICFMEQGSCSRFKSRHQRFKSPTNHGANIFVSIANSAKRTLAELWQKSGNFMRSHFWSICAAVLLLEHRRSEKSGNLASLAPLSVS